MALIVSLVLAGCGGVFGGQGGAGRQKSLHRVASIPSLGEGSSTSGRFSVGCVKEDRCYITLGDGRLFRFQRGKLEDVSSLVVGSFVAAVVETPSGESYVLYRDQELWRFALGRIVAGAQASGLEDRITPLSAVGVETPGLLTELGFVRVAPDGLIWVGLGYKGQREQKRRRSKSRRQKGAPVQRSLAELARAELVPYGVAFVAPDLGTVAYHHQRADGKRTAGVLPVPNDAVDVAFVRDEVWIATGAGVAVLRGDKLRLFTEGHGLRSEILNSVAAGFAGVFVSSQLGVDQLEDERFVAVPGLVSAAAGLLMDRDGRLWGSNENGLFSLESGRIKRWTSRAGKLGSGQLAADRWGRIWYATDATLYWVGTAAEVAMRK